MSVRQSHIFSHEIYVYDVYHLPDSQLTCDLLIETISASSDADSYSNQFLLLFSTSPKPITLINFPIFSEMYSVVEASIIHTDDPNTGIQDMVLGYPLDGDYAGDLVFLATVCTLLG